MNTTTAVSESSPIEVEAFLRESGVLGRIQRQAFDCDLKRRANEHGFEVLRISHRHDPAVEVSLYFGTENGQPLKYRLRSKVARLLKNQIVTVPASKVFCRYRRSTVRIACVPSWD